MAFVTIAAALAAAAVSAPSAYPSLARPASVAADADPAIWVVNDQDTTIYLFGTFHALDGRAQWFNDEVRTAFARSDELVLETVLPTAVEPLRMAPAPLPNGLQGVRNLAVTPTASFLASTRLAISAGRARGIKTANGADVVLRAEAEAEGKPVTGLESLNFQIAMFDRMPAQRRAHSAAAPGSAPNARTSAALGALIGQMQSAWNRGDQGLFVALIDQMRASSPDSYKLMFTERNRNWAGWIAQRLEKPGVIFVAVGAAHLVGRDSVQAKLAELGVRSARIN
jgi:uncharacterized protein YbaP (TraB family)